MSAYGRLRQDNDCHWYLVPEVNVGAFDLAMNAIGNASDLDPDASGMYEDFDEDFRKFRLSGGPEDCRVSLTGGQSYA